MPEAGSGARGPRLRRQLTLAALLPLVAFGLLAVVISAYGLRQVSLSLALQRDTALVQVAAAALAENLEGTLQPLEITAGLLAPYRAQPEQQVAILREQAPFLAYFEGGVVLLDATGLAVATTPGHEERLGLNYAFRDYFQTASATGRPVYSTVVQEQPSGRAAVGVGAPVPAGADFGGLLIGVLFLGSDPWPQALEPLRTPQGGQVYLVDAARQVIYHPDPESIGSGLQADQKLLALVTAGRPGSVLHHSSLFDQPAIVSFAPLPGIGWGLILEEPWRAVLAPTTLYQWIMIALLMAGAVLSLAALLLTVQHVTQPLTALVQQAGRVASGVPFEPLPRQGPAEVRTLIAVFNRMVLRLAEQQAALRQYALQVLGGQEDERRRLARELHDDTVQELVGLAQRIELCRGRLAEPDVVAERLDELQALAHEALRHVRRMSNDLRPHLLEDLGLPAALRALCDDLGRDIPARVHCEVVGTDRRLPHELELTVFRVVQEALTNVRKHARGATRVNVTLYFEKWGVQVTVEDDGPGLPWAPPDAAQVAALVRQGHLGLAGMAERAHLFGGSLDITSGPGQGTAVSLHLESPAGL